LERLEAGPVRGMRRWPAMMVLVRAGFATWRLTARWPFAEYELTERGRRKANHYRAYGAGKGK
jgi:hypothetical protein